jgi:hypothetical protein
VNVSDLFEARLAPLYHGTSLSAALEMLHEDTLWAGASLSRSYDVAGQFADKTPSKLDDNRHGLTPLGRLEYEADLGTYAIIAFDQGRLMHNVGLQPYNWFHGNDTSAETYQRGSEFEEVTKRNAKPITRYITGIEAGDFDRFAPLVLEKLPEYRHAVEKLRGLLVPDVRKPRTISEATKPAAQLVVQVVGMKAQSLRKALDGYARHGITYHENEQPMQSRFFVQGRQDMLVHLEEMLAKHGFRCNMIPIFEAVHGMPAAETEDYSKPFISAWIGDTVAHVYMLYVPKAMRSQGVGRRTYEEWEAKLPPSVERVELEAVDYGDGAGDASPFWDSLGFSYKYDGSNLTTEAQQAMWKGVNGHEVTTIYVDDEDDL